MTGIEVNRENEGHVHGSHQNAGKIHNLNIVNISFANVAKSKYVGRH
jgi:hypothetical protein